jgi:hypothetical protein
VDFSEHENSQDKFLKLKNADKKETFSFNLCYVKLHDFQENWNAEMVKLVQGKESTML